MKSIGYAVAIFSVFLFAFEFAGEYYAADVCLDAGQVYDYATSQCRSDIQTLPYSPYTAHLSWVAILGSGGVALGLILARLANKKAQ